MIYGYLRVSTSHQDCENQKIGINNLAAKKGFEVNKWIYDSGVSGMKDYKARKLGRAFKKMKSGDIILASEISRLSRSMFVLFEILKFLTDSQIALYTVKDNYSLDGTIQSKVLAFGLGLAAEIERDMISKRTKEALENARAKGKRLGRPKGTLKFLNGDFSKASPAAFYRYKRQGLLEVPQIMGYCEYKKQLEAKK